MPHAPIDPTEFGIGHASHVSPTDPITQAGAIVEAHSFLRHSLILNAIQAMAPGREASSPAIREPSAAVAPRAPTPAKQTKAQSRAARQEAMRGARLMRQGRYSQAIPMLRRSAELDPTVAAVHHDLGIAGLMAGFTEEAVSAFASALRLEPGLISAQYNLACALEHLGRRADALAAYEATVRLDPGHQMAWLRLGQLYLERHRQRDAEAAFRAAAAIDPGSAMSRLGEACAADAAGDGGAAQQLLRTLVADEPTFAAAHLILGQVLTLDGQSDEAASSIERAISLNPGMVAAWQEFATSRKFAPADQALIERIRTSLEGSHLTPFQRMSVHFALGKAYDDTGNYGEAIQHFDAANRIRGAGVTLDRMKMAQHVGSIIRATPAGFFDRARQFVARDETPVLIVGMPRSGTTLVEQILSSHPQVAAGGELGFWIEKFPNAGGTLDTANAPEVACTLAEEYLAALRAISADAARVTDKTPGNFFLLGIIRQIFPRAMIVHCRRHPVDTCLSIFKTPFSANFDFLADRGSLAFFYRQYERLMEHWRNTLSRDRFVEVDYEDIVDEPERSIRRLIAACGLPWNEACLSPHRNRRRITTASVWQVRQPIYRNSMGRWQHYGPWLGELRQLLPQSKVMC